MVRRLSLLIILLLMAFAAGARGAAGPARAQTPGRTPGPSIGQPAAPGISPAVLNNPHYQAALAFYEPRIQGLQSGESYDTALSGAAKQRLALPEAAPRVNGAAGVWTNLGPNPITNGQIGDPPTIGPDQPVTGRVESIAVSPADPNTAYLAAAGGGIWKTTDGGTTWTPLTDRLTASSVPITLAMGALAIDPGNANIVYAGLGEACNCGDAVKSALGSSGLLKSADGGSTWSLIANSVQFTVPPYIIPANLLTFARIVVDPTSPKTCASGYCGIWAATSIGLFQSSDGGVTWTLQAGGVDANAGRYLSAYDVVLNTSVSPATVYTSIDDSGAGVSTLDGVYISTNGGAFSRATNSLPASNTTTFVGRTSLAIDSSTPSTVYAAIADGTGDTHAPAGGDVLGIFKTTDAGVSWSRIAGNCTLGAATGPCSGYDAWYANALAVDPNNADLLFGVADVFRSTDGGTTWSNISQIGTNGLHVDQHVLTFAGGTVWSGNDGGVWKSTNDGDSWTNLNHGGLVTNQFYQGASIAPYDPSILIGGMQDNGTAFTTGGSTSWSSLTGGDGVGTAIDPRTPVAGSSGPFYSGYV